MKKIEMPQPVDKPDVPQQTVIAVLPKIDEPLPVVKLGPGREKRSVRKIKKERSPNELRESIARNENRAMKMTQEIDKYAKKALDAEEENDPERIKKCHDKIEEFKEKKKKFEERLERRKSQLNALLSAMPKAATA